MQDLATQQASLPALVKVAAQRLYAARTAAEVLVARELAGQAYDAARRAARLARATKSHEDLVAAARNAQADAIEIEALADIRLADEVDAAQACGVLRKPGNRSKRTNSSSALISDVHLTSKMIHNSRKLRGAVAASSVGLRGELNSLIASGTEPTRTALRRHLGLRPQQGASPTRHPSAAVAGNCFGDLPQMIRDRERELAFLRKVAGHYANVSPDTEIGAVFNPDELRRLWEGA